MKPIRACLTEKGLLKFRHILPSNVVNLTSPHRMTVFEDGNVPHDFYMVDISEMNDEQKQYLASVMSRRIPPPESLMEKIEEWGDCPVSCEYLVIVGEDYEAS